MFSMPTIRVLPCLFLAAMIAGCSGEKPIVRAAVQGIVTWEKAPLKEGTIVFVPVDGTRGQPIGAPIIDGEYSLDMAAGPSVGRNRVEIVANKHTGKTIQAAFPATGIIETVEQYLPAKYNKKSTEVADVVDGENNFDFDLTSK